MRVAIAQRIRPFCHLPGTACLIPFTQWQVQAYPTLLKFKNLVTSEQKLSPLAWKGPVWDFTVELDLEKGLVRIFGHTAEGYRCLEIAAAPDGLSIGGKVMPVSGTYVSRPVERLSLGGHKKLDWELVKRKRDLTDVFPVWFRLGQMVPETPSAKAGAAALLQSYPKLEVVPQFLKLFYAGFSGILAPRLTDDDHLGILDPSEQAAASPLILLSEGSKLIRSLFLVEEDDVLSLLPCLPPEFHAGRFVDVKTRQGDVLEIEWSKKQLRRLIIRPIRDRVVRLKLQKPLSSFRLREKLSGKGQRHQASRQLKLEEGKALLLDRFE